MLFREEDEDLELVPFTDRAEAGRVLASKLSTYAGRGDVMVLGLPRGGVAVASAVAGALQLPLDVFAVAKLGTPWNPELAMGAVAEGMVRLLDLSMVKELNISEEDIQAAVAAAQQELKHRQQLYHRGRPQLDLAGKAVILVDDGIATGCSILAVIAAVRRQNAARIVVAVPVAPVLGCSAVSMEADEVVSVASMDLFFAVSQWYQEFAQVSDEDVQQMLRSAGTPASRAA